MTGMGRPVGRRRLAAAGLALLAAGCGEVRDVVATRDGAGGASGAGAACVERCGAVDCPCPPVAQVTVAAPAGTYRIDATEVTVSTYAAWLATNPAPSPTDSVCGWNPSYVPLVGAPEALDSYCLDRTWEQRVAYEPHQPVSCVDWCDAAAYCRWAGKRLCGRIAGGLLTVEAAPTPDGEWYAACSNGGERTYPYGNTFDQQACNGRDSGNLEVPVEVGVLLTCEGGQAGLFDMSGNVSEWIDSCFPDIEPALEACVRAGGAFYQPEPESLTCGAVLYNARHTLARSIGFRCCSDP